MKIIYEELGPINLLVNFKNFFDGAGDNQGRCDSFFDGQDTTLK